MNGHRNIIFPRMNLQMNTVMDPFCASLPPVFRPSSAGLPLVFRWPSADLPPTFRRRWSPTPTKARQYLLWGLFVFGNAILDPARLQECVSRLAAALWLQSNEDEDDEDNFDFL